MKQFIFKKTKLSSVIALATAGVLVGGCADESAVSNTTSVVEDAKRLEIIEQTNPVATVFGVVQDTNGNPIPNAHVSIGGIAAMTDASGAYALQNVPVTGFSATTYVGGDQQVSVASGTPGTPLQISVNSPAGYLDATVSVTPIAGQNLVAVAGSTDASAAQDGVESENALMAVVLSEGLAVSAGLTVVPALGATVEGVLRDNSTGLEIANTVVGLELVNVPFSGSVAQQQVQNNAVGTGYSALPYVATTDENGKFVIEGVPEDAMFNIVVEDWSNSGMSYAGNGNTGGAAAPGISTTPEVTIQNIGDVFVSPIFSNDNVQPFVTSIDGVVTNGSRAVLNDDLDGTQGIKIHFNEPLEAIVDSNSVTLVNQSTGVAGSIITTNDPVLSDDRKSLTVTTTSALPQGTMFDIYLQVADFEDSSNNFLTTGGTTYMGRTLPNYDSITSPVAGTNYVRLQLQTHLEPITNSAAVSNLERVSTRSDIDSYGTDNFEVLRGINAVFDDVDNGSSTSIYQLNNTAGGTATGDRLIVLANAIISGANLSGVSAPADIQEDRARVKFDLADATTYFLTVADSAGVSQTFNTGDVSLVGNNTAGLSLANGVGNVVVLTVNKSQHDGASVELLLDDVSANDVLSITSISTFGSALASTSVTLTDNVAPTTVVQNSYGVGLSADGSGQVNTDYGNGGELAGLGGSGFGTPYLNVTPFLLTPQTNEALPLPRSETWDSLTDAFTSNNTSAASGELEINLTGLNNYAVYDATTIAAWSPGSRTLGVSFSEPVSVASNPDTTGFTASLTSATANPNVLRNDQGGSISQVDLVNVTVDNVVTLANADHNKVLDFTGRVSDTAANSAVNAKVIVRDNMPPMATAATYTGDAITITFNENVSLEENQTITLRGTGASQTITINAENESANTDTSSVTIDLTDEAYNGDNTLDQRTVISVLKNLVFNRGTNTNTTPSSMPTSGDVVSVLDYQFIEDTNGVSWSNWGGAASIAEPAIVITDATGSHRLTSVPVTTGFTAGSGEFTVTYTFSHRVDLGQICGVAGGVLSVSEADFDGCFSLSNGGGAIAIDTSASPLTGSQSIAQISQDGKTLQVTVNISGATTLTTGDTFVINNNVASAWDSTATAIPNTLDDTGTASVIEGTGITVQ